MEGRYREAASLFARAAEQTHSPEARCREAAAWLAAGRLRNAEAALKQVNPKDASVTALALKTEARLLFLKHDFMGAEAAYMRFGRQCPEHADQGEVLAAIHECRMGRNDFAGAARTRRQLRSQYPDSIFLQSISSETPAKYVVQAGLFSARSHAEAMQEKLKQAGFTSFLQSRPVSGKSLWAVQAGAFATRTAAENQVQLLKSAGFVSVVK